MKTPPDYAIQVAREVALKARCAKSKRGVVLFAIDWDESTDEVAVIAGKGFNGQPEPFRCAASEACRRDCAKLCLHAEDRAIRQALVEWSSPPLNDLELLHVKVVDGEVVPGGGPSCWQCSRLVVEVGLRGVWLFEAQRWHTECRCKACSRITTIPQGGGTTGVCAQCDHVGNLLDVGKRVYDLASGAWRFYSAVEFQRATLSECWLGDDLQRKAQ